jgi:uncharacterized protein involved in exopolysaccharide biosynthesis
MQTAITTNVSRSGFTPRAIVEGLFRQRQLFFWTASVILVATLVATFLKHKQYVSEMKFLVLNTRGNVVITPGRTNSANVASDVSETQVNSELEILHSHDVLDAVADPEWSRVPQIQRTPATIRQHEKLISAFEQRFGTEIVRKTNIINVSVIADAPEKARADLEHLSLAYLAEHRRLQRPSGESDFFKSEAERIRKDWDQASQKLVEFQQQHQIVSLPDRERDLNTQVTEHERDLLATDASLRELDARLAASAARLHYLPMRQTTVETVVPNQQSAQVLNTLLVELENKRTALLTNFKSNDRFVAELDQQIATTKAALSEANVATSRAKSTDVDPAWQSLHNSYVQTEINRRQTAVHRASAAAELTALRQDLGHAQELTVQFNNLEAQATQAKQNYELYSQKRDEAQIEDAMDEQKLINVAVAQEPTLSYVAVSPKPLSNAMLGAVTSLFLGLCAVYLAESGRSTLATPRELDGASRYPVLATIPRISLWDGRVLERPLDGGFNLPALPQPVDIDEASSSSPYTLLKPWGGANA